MRRVRSLQKWVFYYTYKDNNQIRYVLHSTNYCKAPSMTKNWRELKAIFQDVHIGYEIYNVKEHGDLKF